jgi:hypothetical protein
VWCFQKAIEINPNRLMHYVELGQTYAQMGKTADARRLIAKGLAMPDVEKMTPRSSVVDARRSRKSNELDGGKNPGQTPRPMIQPK